MSKVIKFIDNHIFKIQLVVVIIGVLCAGAFLAAERGKSIEDQKNNLYYKEERIAQEMTSISDIPDFTTVRISKDKVYVVFDEKDCKLELVYDKNMNLESKELKDTRLISNFSFCIFVIIISAVGCYIACAIICPVLQLICESIETRKTARKEKEK